MVAACSGLDVLCHAIESLTALPYRPAARPGRPAASSRLPGREPDQRLWAARAIEMVRRYIVRAVEDPDDDEARGQMLLAAAFAGIGFGNAGRPPAARDVLSRLRAWCATSVPEGYPADHAIMPHGMSVILNAPAVFRWTAPGQPGAPPGGGPPAGRRRRRCRRPRTPARCWPSAIIALMRRTGMPNGLARGRLRPRTISTPGGRHAPPAPRHEALAAPGRAGRPARALPGAMRYW